MGSVYEARLKNAKEVAKKLQKLLDAGYLMFDGGGEPIGSVFCKNEEMGYKWLGSENSSVICFSKEFGEGFDETIEAFNAHFSKWKVLHPDAYKPASHYLTGKHNAG